MAVLLRATVALSGFGTFSRTGDEHAYDALARSLLEGRGLIASTGCGMVAVPGKPTSTWGLGQPVYLALVYLLAGPGATGVFLANALCGGLVVWVTGQLGWRLFSPGAGLLAALLAAIDPHAILFSASLYSEPPYMALLMLSLWALFAMGGQPTWRRAALAGLLLGATTLHRATAFYFIPLAVAALLWWRGRALLRPLGVMLLAAAATLAPWVVRNNLVHDNFVFLDTKAGWNLWIVSHPDSNRERAADDWLAPPPGLSKLSESGRNRLLKHIALERIRRDPWTFVRRGVGNVAALWWPLPSSRTSAVGRVAKPLYLIPLEALALLGAVLAWPRRRELGLLYSLPLFYSGVHFLMWGGPRFRLPVDPVLALFASFAAVWLAHRARAFVAQRTA